MSQSIKTIVSGAPKLNDVRLTLSQCYQLNMLTYVKALCAFSVCTAASSPPPLKPDVGLLGLSPAGK